MSRVVAVNDENFEREALEPDVPTLVDFWAEWCGPCRMIGPVIDRLAEKYAGRVKVVKMNTETSFAVPIKYQIRGIPTLLVFKDGEEVERIVGVVPEEVVASALDRALGDEK